MKAAAQRLQHASLEGLSPRDRLDSSASQVLSDVALVCVVPITSVFRARILGQSVPASETMTAFDIVKEVCLALLLTLLSALFLKRVLPQWKQVACSGVQPTKGACTSEFSPKNGLYLLWRQQVARPLKFARRCIQRRRLYMHQAMERFEGFVPSLLGTPDPLQAHYARPSSHGSHGMHDWHEARPAGFLMPLEVAACRSHPDVCGIVQRLVADRWDEMSGQPVLLTSVPEDDVLLFDQDAEDDEECVDLVEEALRLKDSKPEPIELCQ